MTKTSAASESAISTPAQIEPRRPNETMEAFVIRSIRTEEREECAKIAERLGDEFREYAIGGAIAKAIRARSLVNVDGRETDAAVQHGTGEA